jgi:hypothetical protein
VNLLVSNLGRARPPAPRLQPAPRRSGELVPPHRINKTKSGSTNNGNGRSDAGSAPSRCRVLRLAVPTEPEWLDGVHGLRRRRRRRRPRRPHSPLRCRLRRRTHHEPGQVAQAQRNLSHHWQRPLRPGHWPPTPDHRRVIHTASKPSSTTASPTFSFRRTGTGVLSGRLHSITIS